MEQAMSDVTQSEPSRSPQRPVESAATPPFDSIERQRAKIERRLGELLPDESCHPEVLHEAMRYSLLGGGKRVRPLLTMLVSASLGADEDLALDPACAIEMVHTASLIFDDMPCMDDATLRRGRPANHRVFGEDTAILAATALLNRAFGVVAECDALDPSVRCDLVRSFSDAIGSNGIIAGQYCDLRPETGAESELPRLLQMYGQKTGALFVASVEAGARIARVEESWIEAVRQFAAHLGLAFQIFDDLLDRLGNEHDAGKNIGQDRDKNTLVSCIGSGRARAEASVRVRSATQALEPLGDAGRPLVDLAHLFMEPASGMALHY
jgi:geranylgeranyl diphosphate synthase type II